MIFETHAHYDDAKFDEDRDEIISSLLEHGIGRVIDVMADMDSLEKVRAIIEKYDFIYGSGGVHPSEIYDLNMEDAAKIRNFLHHEKCVAVGEIGLDYSWDSENKEQQRYWFELQSEMAREENLPVIVHTRDAAEDTARIAREVNLGSIGGVIHCFSYSKEMAKQFLDMGLYLGIGGVVTFKNARKVVEAVEYAPLDRLLLETDCPYLAPTPHRGERNCSLYLPLVAERIANIKGITTEEVIEVTCKNAMRLFKL